MAIAALEDNVIGIEDKLFCSGQYLVGNRIFKCWKESGHGWIALEDAIIQSCDVYFYQLGLKVGPTRISDFARLFGLGEPTGIDLLSEAQGLVPNPNWKSDSRNESWYDGDIANLSIGQGYVLATPMQMFRIISAVVNGGYLIRPHLIKSIVDIQGKVIQGNPEPQRKKVRVSSSTLQFIQESLAGVVRKGTGWRARNEVVTISGKTGTAETSDEERPHNWFVSYAPSKEPYLAMVVVIENREEDISIAAEISGRVLSRIFEQPGG